MKALSFAALCLVVALVSVIGPIEGHSTSLDRTAIITGTTVMVKSGYGDALGSTPASGKGQSLVALPGFPTRNLIQTMENWDLCGQCHRMDAPLPLGSNAPQDVHGGL